MDDVIRKTLPGLVREAVVLRQGLDAAPVSGSIIDAVAYTPNRIALRTALSAS